MVKELGQYFTLSEDLQNKVFNLVKYKSSLLLEPSFGKGHLLKKFKEYDENYPMICYEIDKNIKPIINFNEYQKYIYCDFIKENIPTKFKTIIGNPPYLKQKTKNLYIEFIEKCYEYLENNGELIFIVPSDFIKLTSASSIINKMTTNGSFTDFIFPNNEKLFEQANIDILIFRYEKNLRNNKVKVNNNDVFININNAIITFNDENSNNKKILNELFNVYVGMVSGKDEIYKVDFGNIDILTDKNKVEKYIFIDKFPSNYKIIDEYLELNKETLLERKIKKFNDKNWFEWGAPRNISIIKKYWGKKCIYVLNLTRKNEIAFIGNVQYFSGKLLCLIPKSNLDLEKIILYMNSDCFKKNYVYSNRFKIGQTNM